MSDNKKNYCKAGHDKTTRIKILYKTIFVAVAQNMDIFHIIQAANYEFYMNINNLVYILTQHFPIFIP
jgi:hypothetical protein